MMNIKHIFYLILILGITSCDSDDDFRADCIPANLEDGVIAFYPFIDGAMSDESTNSNFITGPINARPTTDRDGNSNCAIIFDNSQAAPEFLSSSNTGFLNNLDELSISLWYQPLDTIRGAGDFEVLVSRGTGNNCPNKKGEWSLGLFDCRQAVFGYNNSVWANSVTGFANGCQGEVMALTDKWHHVVATKNGEDYKIYFNGNLDESVSGLASCMLPSIAQDVGDLFIGTDYNGRIDDILFYDREISQSEVTQLFELTPCCL